MGDDFAGGLTERVAIEAWVEGRDEAAAPAGYWAARGQAFAAVVPDGGGAVLGEARRSRRRWRVTVRAPVAVTLTSRLLWQSQILAVLAVESDPRQPDRIVLRCEVREA